MRRFFVHGVWPCLALLLFMVPGCKASPLDLITNGSFTNVTVNGTPSNTAAPSQLDYNGYGVQGWTSVPLGRALGSNFVFNPTLSGSAAYSSNGQFGTVQLYTSSNGGSATAPASLVSPDGGNFIAMNGVYYPGSLSQVINGLAIGGQYLLTFYWAASQQAGFDGLTTQEVDVSFGNQTFSTGSINNPDSGFTPWTQVSYKFTASSSTQTLSFLAGGGPSAREEPFALLDGVSLVAVTPEPSSFVLLATGLIGVGAAFRRRVSRQ